VSISAGVGARRLGGAVTVTSGKGTATSSGGVTVATADGGSTGVSGAMLLKTGDAGNGKHWIVHGDHGRCCRRRGGHDQHDGGHWGPGCWRERDDADGW
jgi:hypothetical protein